MDTGHCGGTSLQAGAVPAGLSRRGFIRAAAGSLGLAAAADAAAALPGILPPVWRQTSDRRIRIGVVGGRFGLSFHWHEHPNCTVTAVSDLIPQRRAALQQRYACERAYESLEKLVLDPEIEAVAVFTGAPDHARHVLLCLDHGKHVISAVPACLTLDEAAALKARKEETGLTYMMAETSYYRRECMTARRLYRDGVFGEMVYCEAEYYHPWPPGSGERHNLAFHNGERTWRYGLPPMLYPTHSTAFLIGVTKERLVRVSCVGHRPVGDEMYGEAANAYGNPFDSGMAMFLTDAGHPFRCNVCWNIHAHGERAQWFGTKAALYSAGSGGQPTAVLAEGLPRQSLPDFGAALPPALRVDSGHGGSHPYLTHEFVMSLVEGRAPAVDLYEALAYTVPGIVAHQSSFRDGEQLPIADFDPA
ncbi:MAG: Gfo/Idh/MocA family oxidoreductase [Lentisphaeria bacterium]|nr:Gfo/Idh/MocA family oxidoreductase [Lentisphaeria bacterium]